MISDSPPFGSVVDSTDEYVECEIESEPTFDNPLHAFRVPTRSGVGGFGSDAVVSGCIPCFPSRGPHGSLAAPSVSELAVATGLSAKEVVAMHARFSKIAPRGYMTKEQFKQTLGMLGMTPNDYLPHRMFSVFDANGDGVLTFDEYLASFAVLLRGSDEERMKLSFGLADSTGSGSVSYADFKALIEACQATKSALLESQEPITEAEIQSLFNDIAGGQPAISLEAYVEGVRSNARFLAILGLGGATRSRRGNLPPSPQTPPPATTSMRASASAEQLRSELDRLRQDLIKGDSRMDNKSMVERLDSILRKSSNIVPSPPPSPPVSVPASPTSEMLHRRNPSITRMPAGVRPGLFSGAVSPEVASEGTRPPSPLTGVIQKAGSQDLLAGVTEGAPSSAPSRGAVNVPKKSRRLLGPKKGLAVHFGHENWNMVLSMMIGIRLAVGRASFEINRPLSAVDFAVKDKFSIVPQLSNFLDSKISSKVQVTRFIDYAPLVFRKLREEISGISEAEYMRSVGPEQLLGNMVLGNLSSLAELTTEGKGGAFFYYTADGRFMIKTVTPEEKRLLKQMLREYYMHLNSNKNSFVVRFYGLHGLRVKRSPVLFSSGKYRDDQKIFFVVMGNLFNTPLEVHRRFDLKGSWVNRSVDHPSDTTVALKDNEFVERGETVNVGPDIKRVICDQLRKDCDFFAQHNIIDYSLLLGIHDRRIGNGTGEGGAGDARSFQSLDGAAVYYIGVIDILCQWDTKKKLENFFKSIRYDSKGISAVPPKEYADRFYNFIADRIE